MILSRDWWLSAALAAAVSFAILSPATAQAPPAAASSDPFGEEVTLVEKPIIFVSGSGMWDSAFETITGAFKTVNAALAKAGLKANGPLMTIYTSTDDTGFQFQAAAPVEKAPTLAADSGVTAGALLMFRLFDRLKIISRPL